MKNPITKLKAIVKSKYETKIKNLQEEMENALLFLSRLEKTLSEETTLEDIDMKTIKFTRGAPIRTLKVKKDFHKISTNRTAEETVKAALQETNGEFSYRELQEKSEIKKGTFGGIFSDLVKTGKILVVRERKGNQAGIYKRADQGKTQSESS
jgi:hypothetical protein